MSDEFNTMAFLSVENETRFPILGLGSTTRNGKARLRHKSRQEEVHMLMDNVIAGMAIGVFSFVSVIVVKLAAIAVHPTLKNWTSAIIGPVRLKITGILLQAVSHPSGRRGGNA